MKPGSGKSKGSQWERDVCKALSLWISNGERTDLFWRTAISGGRATRRRQKGEQVNVQIGDICAVDPEGFRLTNCYYIECKHYRDLQVAPFLLTNSGHLARFWDTTCCEADRYHRSPMLIAKQNRLPPIVLVRSDAVLGGPVLSDIPLRECTVLSFSDLVEGRVFLKDI